MHASHWLAGSSSRQPRLLIALYVRNAFADLNVKTLLRHFAKRMSSSRGLLHDCEIFANLRLTFISSSTISSPSPLWMLCLECLLPRHLEGSSSCLQPSAPPYSQNSVQRRTYIFLPLPPCLITTYIFLPPCLITL